MSQAKLAFQLGQISFSGEGSEDWVAKQLDHFLEKVPELSGFAQSADPDPDPSSGQAPAQANVGSLATYIKQKGGDKNQVKRFLITANWLRLKGEKNLKTALVSKALQDNQQKKLGNPSLCLSRNIGQGYCEKTPSGFYITPEGLDSLGAANQASAQSEEPDDTENGSAEDSAETKPKKKKRTFRQPPPGTSCRDRIKVLKRSGFFKDPKTPGEIVVGLGKKGWTHNSSQVGAALTIMFNKHEIQRTKDGGIFKYYWDRD